MNYLFKEIDVLVNHTFEKDPTESNCCVLDEGTNLLFLSNIESSTKRMLSNKELLSELSKKSYYSEMIIATINTSDCDFSLGSVRNVSIYKLKKLVIERSNLVSELGSRCDPEAINRVLKHAKSKSWNNSYYFKLVEKTLNDFNYCLLMVEYLCRDHNSFLILSEIFSDLYKGNTVRIITDEYFLTITLEILIPRRVYESQPLFIEIDKSDFLLPNSLLLRFNNEKTLKLIKRYGKL